MSLEPILSASPAIQIHATAASAAMVLGALMLALPKGTPLHKLMGRTWAALMVVVATAAIFINELRVVGPFSPIHLFVPITYGALGYAIWQVRRGNVIAHRATMVSLYFGALFLTGAFTLLPGRRMHDVLFGAASGWTPALVAIPAALFAGFLLWRRLMPSRPAKRPALG